MNELSGKGWRVLGYFVWMLGAGIVLDSEADRLAAVTLALGLALFLFGAWRSWVVGPGAEKDRPGEQPDSPSRP
jgi:hypothetical protein